VPATAVYVCLQTNKFEPMWEIARHAFAFATRHVIAHAVPVRQGEITQLHWGHLASLAR
jgi:hypothetical protein